MAKRVTHARASEILGKLNDEQIDRVGGLGPYPGWTVVDKHRFIRALTLDMGLTEEEAEELWRYMGY